MYRNDTAHPGCIGKRELAESMGMVVGVDGVGWGGIRITYSIQIENSTTKQTTGCVTH